MNGKINSDGNLQVQRIKTGEYVKQYCPFCWNANRQAACGEWCPLFGEVMSYKYDNAEQGNYFLLELCSGKDLIFDEFSRESGGDE